MIKLSVEEEAAKMICDIQERMVRKIFFRRWMVAVDVVIKYKPRIFNNNVPSLSPSVVAQSPIQNQVTPSQETPEIQQTQKISKGLKNSNLKYGDIIYFKCYQQNENDVNYKGVISGDGIASNILECLRSHKEGEKVEQIFQQVVNAKQYFLQNKLDKLTKEDYQDKNYQKEKIRERQLQEEEVKRKVMEEQAENQSQYQRLYGQNVLFEDDIQLIHLYSNCTLTLNQSVLAKQPCCRELSLEESSNDRSNFSLHSLNQAKKQGEPILYNDQIILVNSLLPQWKLSVQDVNDREANILDGLEVNASEKFIPLKICCYIDCRTQKENQHLKGRFLQSGDLITIKNRHSNGFLAVKYKQLFSQFLERRNIDFIDPESNIRKQMKQDNFEIDKLLQQDSIKQIYEMYVEEDSLSEKSMNCFWEIQLKNPLQFRFPTYQSTFLLKHVYTGCYLMINNSEIQLTHDGTSSQCLFFLKSKKDLNDSIFYSESVKVVMGLISKLKCFFFFKKSQIQSVSNTNLIVMCDKENEKNPVSVTEKQKKADISKTVFVLSPGDSELTKTAQRIFSLNLYLFQFYIFLQDWGMISTQYKSIEYDFMTCFNTQKNLYDEIRQLYQTIENLQDYLTPESSDNSIYDLQFRQNTVRESGIINMLLCILMLIHFMIYGSAQNRQQYYEIPGEKKKTKDNNIFAIPDKSAQKIAKQKLNPIVNQNKLATDRKTQKNCVEEIYQILLLCIQENQQSSHYLLKLNITEDVQKRGTNEDTKIINFLLHQLPYYRISVSNILKESVRYTNQNFDLDQSSINSWLKQLQSVNDTNIEDQCLFIEIMSLLMNDHFDNPIPQCQNIIRRKIFKKTSQKPQSSSPVFDRAFQKFFINEQGKSCVSFQTQSQEDFENDNMDFYQVYKKYRESIKIVNNKRGQYLIDFMNVPTMRQHIRAEEKKQKIPLMAFYETYTLNVLDFYCKLCRGRNYKSIKIIRKYCMGDQFLLKTIQDLKEKDYQLRLEGLLINLYSIISIDSDPLQSIRIFQNKCYIEEDIQTFDMTGPSGKIFFQNSINDDMSQQDVYKEFMKEKQGMPQNVQEIKNNNEQKEHESLKEFATYIILREQKNGIVKQYTNLLIDDQQNYYPKHLKVKLDLIKRADKNYQLNYALYADFQLEYFLSVLKLINTSINLGYNDLETNKKILRILPNIFYALIITQNQKRALMVEILKDTDYDQKIQDIRNIIEHDYYIRKHDGHYSKNWLMEFFTLNTCLSNNKLLILKIYIESIDILATLFQLKKNLQLIKYIGFCKGNENLQDSMKLYNEINDPQDFESEELIKTKKLIDLNDVDDGQYVKFLDIYDEYDEHKKMVNLNSLLFKVLYSIKEKSKMNEDLLKIIMGGFDYYSTLCEQVEMIELISNKLELELFTIINGNNKKYPQIKGPKELEIEVKRMCKTIQQVKLKNKDAFKKIQDYVSTVILVYQTKIKDKPIYLLPFQKIIKNAGIHELLIQTILDPKKVKQKFTDQNDIISYYNLLITFMEIFGRDNVQNQKYLFKNIHLILDIPLIPQTSDKNGVFIQKVNITQLVISVSSQERVQYDVIQEFVDLLINKIEFCMQNLGNFLKFNTDSVLNSPRDVIEIQNIILEQKQDKPEFISKRKKLNKRKEIIYIQAIIQYLKILKSLTRKYQKPSNPIIQNKHLILQNILKIDNMKFMILPGNFLSNYDQLFEQQKSNPIILENKMRLHAAAIDLLTECCHNYRLGIQEIQRTVLYDEIKHNMLHPYCYYIIKRSYLMFLFEVYINRADEQNESNEVIDNEEISDILSRIIIPDIDQKQIFRYMEGLIKNGDQNKELKNSIKVKKNQYFEKNKDIRLQGEQQQDRSRNILADDNEYWKYIRKNGLFYFLVCVYDEIKDRIDLNNSEEQSLADEFSIIKNNIQKLKEIFKILEQDFRMKQDQLNLEEYRDLIVSIEEIIPQRKITKFGTNYSIGFAPNSKLQFEKFDTLNDDLGGEKKIQEQENVLVINNKFKLNMKIYMLRQKIQIDDLLNYCEVEKPQERQIEDVIPIVNYFKSYISKDDLKILEKEEMKEIIQDRQINKKEYNVDKWEIFKIAMRKLFQRKKFVKNVEDYNQEDPNAKDELGDQNEMTHFFKNFQLYINRLAQIYRLKHQKNNFKEREETIFDDLEDELQGDKQQKSIDEQIKKIRNDNNINKQLQDDFSVEILMSQLIEENKFQPNRDFTEFLKICINMFMGREIYIIKLCRIKLDVQKPTDDEIQELGEENQKSEDTLKRYNEFKLYQTCIAEADMDLIALKMMSQPLTSKSFEQRIEAITFLIQLMKYGNADVQKRVLVHLQTNMSLQNNFFQFLKIQLTQEVYENIIEISEQYKAESKIQNPIHQETQFEILSLRILEFLQGLCENVNEEIQQFLTRQSLDDAYTSNINVIRYVCDFLSIYLSDTVLNFEQKNKMINQSLLTLIEFTTGYQDSIENVCSDKRLFSLMNSKILLELIQSSSNNNNYFSPCQNEKSWDHPYCKNKYEIFQTLDSLIQILLAMIKKSKDKSHINNLLNSFDLYSLLCICEQIYNNRIKPKIKGIVLETKCTQIGLHQKCTEGFCIIDNIQYVNDEDSLLIETGFNIFILFNYLIYFQYFPDVNIRKLFEFDQNKEDYEFDLEDNLREQELQVQRDLDLKKQERSKKKGQVSPLQPARMPTNIKQQLEEEEEDEQFRKQNQNNIQEVGEHLIDQANDLFHKRTMEFFQFYKEFLGRVEIQRKDGILEKVFYQKPFFSRFITSQIKQHLIQKSNRNSDEERLYSLIENSNFYHNQMTHNQFMTRYKILNIGAKNWRTLKDISFCLCVFLTFILIIYYDSIYTNQEPNQNILNIFSIVSYIQLALSIIICVFSSIERYPISITKSFDTGARRLMILKNEAGFKLNDFTKLYNSFRIDKLDKKKVLIKLLLISIDQDNLYNLVYLIITIFAHQYPVLYAYLLLDIVYRSEDLQNIIRSITSNLGNLLKFCVLGLIGLLLFGTIGYDKFKDYYDESSGAYTSEFRYTIYSTINMGLRSGGGIGDVMNPINPSSSQNYWGEYFFELCFFILFNILFIQIVFGIILDTFGELRDERQALLAEIIDKCFVCSLKRNDIDSKFISFHLIYPRGELGWYYHIYLEHNVYHMLYYIIYLKNKNLNYCDSLEKYVKSLIQNKDTRFFPNGKCLQLPEFTLENTEKSNDE